MPTKTKKQKIGPWQDAWIRTLESGLFEQNKGLLCQKTNDGYSFYCLGIACEVLIENRKRLKTKVVGGSDPHVEYGTTKDEGEWLEDACLPKRAVEIFAFYDSYGSARKDKLSEREWFDLREMLKYSQSLACANDSGTSFKQIAKTVRKYPQAFFSKPA